MSGHFRVIRGAAILKVVKKLSFYHIEARHRMFFSPNL
jgi:hypothetical protein